MKNRKLFKIIFTWVFILFISFAAKAQKENLSENYEFSQAAESSGLTDFENLDPFDETVINSNDIFSDDADSLNNKEVLKVSVVLSDIYGKKDMEFVRGLLLGIKNADLPPQSIAIKVTNSEIPADSLNYELDTFDPHLILTTHEKDVPRSLISYVTRNGKKLLNIFDAKGEDYLNNQGIYQILTPSGSFNKNVAKAITDSYGEYTLIIVGEPEPGDAILKDISQNWPNGSVLKTNKEDIATIELNDNENYIIYPAASTSATVKDVISEFQKIFPNYPEDSFIILGRPNWVAFGDLNSLVAEKEVLIPSKCYFDPTSSSGKKFISEYYAAYGHAPIRSFPVFSVMGYDTAIYFFPLFLAEINNEIPEWSISDMLQSRFDMVKADWNSGVYNEGSYLIHFEPWGTLQKEPVK